MTPAWFVRTAGACVTRHPTDLEILAESTEKMVLLRPLGISREA
jgi:hypothetical protein